MRGRDHMRGRDRDRDHFYPGAPLTALNITEDRLHNR